MKKMTSKEEEAIRDAERIIRIADLEKQLKELSTQGPPAIVCQGQCCNPIDLTTNEDEFDR
jgi:hypothetical protein